MKKNLLWLLVPALLMFATTSCVTHKPVQYLEGSFDTIPLKNVQWQEPVIQPGDLISIVVYSDNAAAAAIYNQVAGVTSNSSTSTGIAAGSTSGTAPGYLVNSDGNITVIGIGIWKVAGKTKKQVSEELIKYFIDKNTLQNPIVDIRFLNYKITVQGEVAHPGSFSIPNERVNILEAIALAGDFGPYARREIVTIIRENNGVRSFVRLDMNDPSIFTSPYYQLQQNDIVMVPANKRKEAANDQLTFRYITIGTSILSATAILISIFR